jgi:hypothetical protein
MIRLRPWELEPTGGDDFQPASSRPADSQTQAAEDPQPASDHEGPDETQAQNEAGHELAELLLQLHTSGRLSAKDTCLLSHWATKAGAVGPARSLAKGPGAPSGHYQRHLDRAAGLRGSSDEFYALQIPGHTKHSVQRVSNLVRVVPPHEILHKEHAENPDLAAKLEDPDWPPHFANHKIMKGSPGSVVPLALYLDAAQYATRGAVLLFVICNLLSGARHLCCVLKKKDMCRCGCRGWCSLRPVMELLNWSFAALARGLFPLARHDGTTWDQSEPHRLSLAGLPLALKGAIVQIKGDWAEFSHSLGFPTWRDSEHPCIWCRCDKETLYTFEGLDEPGLPWDPIEAAEYEIACQRCERHVVVTTEDQRARILALLFYDKRAAGSHGRSLRKDIPELLLKAGDRLEPNAALPDVGKFEQIPLPATVLFWRVSLETATRHRNPLFNVDIGISPNTLQVDPLHCLYLGIFQVHAARVVWALIDADAWQTGSLDGHWTEAERLQMSCIRMQADLHEWCKNRRRTHPEESITEVQEITTKMIGGREEQRFTLKGGEAKTFLLFLQDLLSKTSAQVKHAKHMLQAGAAFQQYMRLCKEAPRKFNDAQQKDWT